MHIYFCQAHFCNEFRIILLLINEIGLSKLYKTFLKNN